MNKEKYHCFTIIKHWKYFREWLVKIKNSCIPWSTSKALLTSDAINWNIRLAVYEPETWVKRAKAFAANSMTAGSVVLARQVLQRKFPNLKMKDIFYQFSNSFSEGLL